MWVNVKRCETCKGEGYYSDRGAHCPTCGGLGLILPPISVGKKRPDGLMGIETIENVNHVLSALIEGIFPTDEAYDIMNDLRERLDKYNNHVRNPQV